MTEPTSRWRVFRTPGGDFATAQGRLIVARSASEADTGPTGERIQVRDLVKFPDARGPIRKAMDLINEGRIISVEEWLAGQTPERGTEKRPRYYRLNEPRSTNLFMILVDEGWRSSILCGGMYDWQADWLISELQGKPYAPGHSR